MDLKSFIFHFFSAIPDFKSFWRRDTNSVVIFKINFKIFKLVLACKAFFFNLKQKVQANIFYIDEELIKTIGSSTEKKIKILEENIDLIRMDRLQSLL